MVWRCASEELDLRMALAIPLCTDSYLQTWTFTLLLLVPPPSLLMINEWWRWLLQHTISWTIDESGGSSLWSDCWDHPQTYQVECWNSWRGRGHLWYLFLSLLVSLCTSLALPCHPLECSGGRQLLHSLLICILWCDKGWWGMMGDGVRSAMYDGKEVMNSMTMVWWCIDENAWWGNKWNNGWGDEEEEG